MSLFAVALISAPRELPAQAVRGIVIDSVSRMPVGSGFVVLLDSSGFEVARSLSDRDGRFSLRAPSPGLYRLRSERIGFRAFLSEPLDLSDGQILDFTLSVAALAVRLATLVVRGRDRCSANPEQGANTLLIWEEIRKALAATAWGDAQELFHYKQYSYRRNLNERRNRKFEETGIRRSGFTDPPFRSVPAEQLAKDGYVVERSDGIWYYLPDAHTMLDDGFLNTHCFHVVRDSDDRAGQVGLAFEPMSERELPDVEGTLWLDEASSELRELEVRHTGVKYGVRDRRVGGTVRFLRLPSGAWIVRDWQVRTPRLSVTENPRGNRGYDARVAGFTDTGGEIYEVSTRDGTKVYEAPVARVTGTVFDSTAATRLQHAFVTVVGTDFRTHTDSAGRFAFSLPLEGHYLFVLSHPRLDSVAAASLAAPVELMRDSTIDVAIGVPHVRTASRRLCGRGAEHPEFRTIFGVVREAGSGTPVADASVAAVWQEIDLAKGHVLGASSALSVSNNSATNSTDTSGFFSICGVPAGRPIRLWAEKEFEKSREAGIVFPDRLGGSLLMAWDKRPGAPYEQEFNAPQPAWKIDLVLGSGRPDEVVRTSSVLQGVVTDSATGDPLEGVTVVVNDSFTTVTAVDGRYEVAGVVWRPTGNRIEFRGEGYATATLDAKIGTDDGEILLDMVMSKAN